MKISRRELIVVLLVVILIAFIPTAAAAPTGISESAVVDAAKGWIGVKEVHAGNSRSGIDCSHLVYQVYKEVGVKGIEFQTVPNMKLNKHYVTTTSPTPGDIIFWKKDVTQGDKKIWLTSHVGIYIGNGQFIHPDHEITTDSVSGIYKEGVPYYARWESDGSGSNLPAAAFDSSPASGNAPLTVSFIDKSAGATSWDWAFGDGSTSTQKNPSHTYSTAGSFSVKLTVSNENGSDSQSDTITVSGQPAPVLPRVDFNSNLTTGSAPLTVKFTDSSQNAAGWSWDFGDGTTSFEQNPVHTYFSAGSYNVNLIAANANGTNSKSDTIIVSQAQETVLPAASFNADPALGYAPLTVNFMDSSQNADAWSWDFGDEATSNEQSPSHIYLAEGTYTVTLTASNANGSASQTASITVQNPNSSDGGSSGGDGGSSDGSNGESSHSSHSHGSGGGGGAGGSPEPQTNVEAKELSQTFIGSGQTIKFDFPQKVTPVVNISFDSKKTAGKTTTISEMLKNKSTLTSDVPGGEVDKYFNIWVGNGGFGNSKNIENAVVYFKVEKSWIQDKKIDKSTITLIRYSDRTWNDLPTSLSGEDDIYQYFFAKTPGFSPFAITGKMSANETVNSTQSVTLAGPDAKNSVKNSSNAENITQTPEQTEHPVKKTPGFEITAGIICLSGIFLYKRR